MTEPLTGLDEAVEAACRAFYLSWDWDDDDPDDLEHCRIEMGRAISAARPIIAAAVRADLKQEVDSVLAGMPAALDAHEAAVRADERRRVLAEVAERLADPCCVNCVQTDLAALTEPTP